MAACLAVVASFSSALTPASADQAAALVSQRQALQQQVSGLGGDKAKALSDLLAAQDALNNLQGALRANTAYLADLTSQQNQIRGKIANTEHDLAQQRSLVSALSRGQYKTMTGDQAVVLIFNSSDFRDMLSRVMAEITVQRRVADTARHIKAEQAQLKLMSADLARKQGQATQVQSNLEQENGRELALVADYDQRVAHIDGESKALLGQINGLNQQIAAAQAPPPPPRVVRNVAAPSGGGSTAFGPGTGTVNGGGSCGNHFSYGYCTWYVANRRCIPWFGNAWEWYGAAQSYGYPVGQAARVGAVAVWDQRMSGYGHVAYVESVQPNGFTVSEMNYNAWGQVNTRFVPFSNPGPLTGFVYAR